MNENVNTPTVDSSKSHWKLKRRHLYFMGSLVAIAIVLWIVDDYGTADAGLVTLCTLGTLTMTIALAAFFKAYAKD